LQANEEEKVNEDQDSVRVSKEVQSQGSNREILKNRDIRAHVSKHLDEDKIQRKATLALFYKSVIRP
jgi:hypothetical protein